MWVKIERWTKDENDTNSTTENKLQSDLNIYWSQMEKLYEDTKKEEAELTVITNKDSWRTVINQIQGKDNLDRIPYFLTSTAYHNSKKCFVDYEGTTIWSANYSDENCISLRRSMGVLEMMLHILKKNGFDLNHSGISYSGFRTIGNKIG